ncbi:isoprenyl transferase, partial [Mesorhizobium sp. M7A.T.Ca.TU.009.01.3.1]
AAYSELVFLPCYWPDLSREHLAEALREFAGRERRFGGLGGHDVASRPAAG